ncbi:P-loop containing nucleoside triphosphate hydrolase [Sesbania bispinosa]|nr:P-loop containing nucleoside triphosphate hydrolase [Sesbania bispinosa]
METWESFGDHIELNSQSLGDGDSNALILPAKRMKKRNGVEQGHGKVQSNKKQKLSKPQKRKLKKSEDDKEKQLLLAKAIKTLNENALPEYAYPLLQSSCNINRDETVKEKHRRVVHFLKEGLEVPHDDELSKKQDFPCRIEPETEEIHLTQAQEFEENDTIQPIRTEGKVLSTTSVPLESTQEPVQGNEVVNYKSVAEPLADISIDTRPDEIRSSSPTSCSNDEIKSTKSKDKTDGNPATNFNELKNLPDFSAQRPLTAPTVVHVYRPPEVEAKRKDLPIVMMEQEIMEAINEHSSVIICGETGCGKTTQVPQFLYEAGYGSSKSHAHNGIIGVTQPRRVAVLATAKRVAYELGLHLGKEVGFQVRYDKRIGENCSIKFMTDGILLREVQVAYRKVLAIHKRLPPGGILVFVTGQREVEDLCRKLRKASREFIVKKVKGSAETDGTMVCETNSVEGININEINEAFEIPESSAIQQTDRFSGFDEDGDDVDWNESVSSYNSEAESELEFNDDDDSLEHSENKSNIVDVLGNEGSLASLKAAFEKLSEQAPLSSSNGEQTSSVNTEDDVDQSKVLREKRARENCSPSPGALFVLPLYAMLPAAAQLRVFEEVQEGERLVVVATNVAETSLTIPGIKYVVDTGREKVKNYDSSNGMETYEVQWISKASAAQRAGRAGRTGPGHCYRLYSSAAFSNEFPEYSPAEVEKVPVHGVVLLLKSMHIKKVANFPFPTSIKAASLLEAENCLKALEALDSMDELTLLGKAMALYPLSPRHSRMILTVIKNTRHGIKCNPSLLLAYAVAAAAALSLSNPFCFEQSQKSVEFCDDNALHFKTMEEMSKLRQQLLKLVFYQSDKGGFEEYSWIHGTLEDVEHAWRVSSAKYPLSLLEERLICQAICAGWADRVAKRITASSKATDGEKSFRAVRYQSCMVEESVFLHRLSSVSIVGPEFVVYNELLETKRPNKDGVTSARRAYIHGVTSVEPAWLVEHAKSSCIFSPPLMDPRPFYDAQTDQVKCWVIPTFGRFCWELPKHSLPISNDEHRVQVFAYALLEGQVCPCLKSVRKYMSAPPESIMKREAYSQKRVGNLLSKLKSRLIDSSAMLRMVWKENPRELFSEILDWFQQSFHKHFEELWLQMLSEVLLEAQVHPLGKKRIPVLATVSGYKKVVGFSIIHPELLWDHNEYIADWESSEDDEGEDDTLSEGSEESEVPMEGSDDEAPHRRGRSRKVKSVPLCPVIHITKSEIRDASGVGSHVVPAAEVVVTEGQPEPLSKEAINSKDHAEDGEPEIFGNWMIAQRKSRRNQSTPHRVGGNQGNVNNGTRQEGYAQQTRYDVLGDQPQETCVPDLQGAVIDKSLGADQVQVEEHVASKVSHHGPPRTRPKSVAVDTVLANNANIHEVKDDPVNVAAHVVSNGPPLQSTCALGGGGLRQTKSLARLKDVDETNRAGSHRGGDASQSGPPGAVL